jgi:xylulose-5-phosphate/fructose-6-phosphate phosphoketolase
VVAFSEFNIVAVFGGWQVWSIKHAGATDALVTVVAHSLSFCISTSAIQHTSVASSSTVHEMFVSALSSAHGSDIASGALSQYLRDNELALLQSWWNAANYLTIGQIYLQDNCLLRRPLQPSDIKPRLLGHWGTSPGLSLLYVHLNRIIKAHDLNLIFLVGPGHGGPAIVANAYLEGTYCEVYPNISNDAEGVHRLFRQFSTPGGIPSHVSPQTPGSIHEGGELGYVLTHAFGAAMDSPDLIVVAVVGDGEAETGPLEGSWKGISFLNPITDGAVLPVLHLNGYKISGPTVSRYSVYRILDHLRQPTLKC